MTARFRGDALIGGIGRTSRIGSLARGVALALAIAISPLRAGAADSPIVAANEAWRSRDLGRLESVIGGVRGHVLEPYFEYWRVSLQPGDARIQQYLDRYPKTILADQLRADWIRGLARRADWALLTKQYDQLERRAPDVSCWGLRARWERGDFAAGAELLKHQFTQPRDLPEGCAAVARGLAAAGRLAPEIVWPRARALAGLGEMSGTRATLGLLPKADVPSSKLMDLAFGVPTRLLETGLFDPRRRTDRELVAMAVGRVAIDDPVRAQKYLGLRNLHLDAGARAWVYGQMALGAARRLLPESLDWFVQARGASLTDEHYMWWTRVALREQRWPQVREAIARMSESLRAESRWQYWLGRALREGGEQEAAVREFSLAAREHSFYGRLAVEALGWARMLPPSPIMPTRSELEFVARETGIARSVALHRADLRLDAMREWDWTVRHWDDRQLAVAARYAEQLSMWERVVDSGDRTARAHDFGARYPLPYQRQVRAAAYSFGVEEALVFGVIRQESRFATQANSSSGARGLMQLMPTTASWVAGRLGWRAYDPKLLTDPDRNIQLGTRYLQQLHNDLGGNMVLSVAGYNAGPGRAIAWRGTRAMEGAIFAESIPIDETREYVKHVIAGVVHYQERITGLPQSLMAQLGTVASAGSAGS